MTEPKYLRKQRHQSLDRLPSDPTEIEIRAACERLRESWPKYRLIKDERYERAKTPMAKAAELDLAAD